MDLLEKFEKALEASELESKAVQSDLEEEIVYFSSVDHFALMKKYASELLNNLKDGLSAYFPHTEIKIELKVSNNDGYLEVDNSSMNIIKNLFDYSRFFPAGGKAAIKLLKNNDKGYFSISREVPAEGDEAKKIMAVMKSLGSSSGCGHRFRCSRKGGMLSLKVSRFFTLVNCETSKQIEGVYENVERTKTREKVLDI